jgi:very-short-patch-repair endonuclease
MQGATASLFEDSLAAEKPKRRKRGDPRKDPSELFAFECDRQLLPKPAREHRFAKKIGRQWRFDFAFLKFKLAVEIEGLVVRKIGGETVVTGRHATISGFREDCEKYATATAVFGWSVLRFEQGQVRNGYALDMTKRALALRGWKP